jgi:hypothetical protein
MTITVTAITITTTTTTTTAMMMMRIGEVFASSIVSPATGKQIGQLSII